MDRFTRMMVVIGVLTIWGIYAFLFFRKLKKDVTSKIEASILAGFVALAATLLTGVLCGAITGTIVWVLKGG